MTQNTVFQWFKNNFLLSHTKLLFFTRFCLWIILKLHVTIQAWCLEKQYPQEICWILCCQKYSIAILMIRKRYNEIGWCCQNPNYPIKIPVTLLPLYWDNIDIKIEMANLQPQWRNPWSYLVLASPALKLGQCGSSTGLWN